MAQVKKGDKVKVHFTGHFKDGKIFESTSEDEPAEFITGQDMLIPGFEKAVVGMEEGKTKSVTLPPEEAYGHYKEDLIYVIERSNIPDNIDPELGMKLKARTLEGKFIEVTVKEIDEITVTLDGNHPFAGKDIVFDIKLLEIL